MISLPRRAPSFDHIVNVLLLRSRKQMTRIATEPIVACMPNNLSARDWADTGDVCNVVGIVGSSSQGGPSVSPLGYWPNPMPTGIVPTSLIYAIENRFSRIRLSVLSASLRAIAPGTAWRTTVDLAAMRTLKRWFCSVRSEFVVQAFQSARMRAKTRSCRFVRFDTERLFTDGADDQNKHNVILSLRSNSASILPYPSHYEHYGSLAVVPVLSTPLGEE